MNWRRFLTEKQSQLLLTGSIILTLEKVAHTCCDEKIISIRELEEFKSILKDAVELDITQVFSLLRHRFINTNISERSFSISYALKRACENKLSNNTKKNIFLNFRFRELYSLCDFLRFARNVAVHDFSERSYSWSLCVASSFLRLTEIAYLPKDPHVRATIDNLREELNHSIGYSAPSFNEKAQPVSISQKQILDKLDTVESVLEKLDIKISKTIPPISKDVNSVAEEIQDLNEDKEDIVAHEEHISLITEEQLRQELQRTKSLIDTKFAEENIWTGLESNILKSSNIDEIIQLRPESIEKLLESGSFASDYSDRKIVYDAQISEFGNTIDRLLGQTVWE